MIRNSNMAAQGGNSKRALQMLKTGMRKKSKSRKRKDPARPYQFETELPTKKQLKTLNLGKGISSAHRQRYGRDPPASIDPESPGFLGNYPKDPITVYVDKQTKGTASKRFNSNTYAEQSTLLINLGDATRSSHNSTLMSGTRNQGSNNNNQLQQQQPSLPAQQQTQSTRPPPGRLQVPASTALPYGTTLQNK
jgi:hypothetical protein